MKVNIGPPRFRWVSYVHEHYMDKKHGRGWEESTTRFEWLLENIEDGLQWAYNHTINLYLDNRSSQKIKVRIDKYDTWSMDHTLAYIVVPMLKQLKATKHGAPYVDDEDVPEEYRSTIAPPKKDEYDIDDFHFKRWDWVLDEMIWTFEQKTRGDWESDYYKFESVTPNPNANTFFETVGTKLVWEDHEGRKAHQERITNGLRLFGKYYETLWD